MKQQSFAINARRLRIAVIALMVLILGAYAASRLGLDLGHAFRVERRPGAAGSPIVADLAILLFGAALFEVTRLLRRFEQGELFTPGVTGSFRAFARWLLLAALIAIVGPAIAGLLEPGTEGGRQLRLIFDLRDVMAVVAALLIVLIARVLDEAARIDTELREIV